MKIGAVCEQTGLTDRTVRYYTEEGLLNPGYTKNYLGRKTFDFSEEDVAMLKDIAVLRKYGFAIPEIKSILEDPAKSVEIIEALRQKKRETIQSEQELLDVLLTLEKGKPYTVPELAEALNTPKLEETELPEEPDDGCLLLLCKIQFWWICAPLTMMVLILIPFMLWDWESTFLYKKYYPDFGTYILCAMGWFVPVASAAAMIFLEGKRGRMDRALRSTLIILLTLFHTFAGLGGIVIASIGASAPPFYSETEDTADYMILGALEQRTIDGGAELLFPKEIPQYALGNEGQPCPETTRYYNYVDGRWGSKYEVFAQWQLTPDDLEKEKNRIQEMCGEIIKTTGYLGSWEYWSLDMDPVKCGNDPLFHRDYLYIFFAYHEETGMVRYIASYTSECLSTPAFLVLDWN